MVSASVHIAIRAGRSSLSNTHITPSSGGRESDVRWDMSSFPTTTRLSLFRVLRRWYRRSVWPVFVEELCSLPSRIAKVQQMRAWERRGYTGLDPQGFPSPQAPPSRLWKHAYIDYMQRLPRSLTIFDRLLVERAWWDGLAWNARIYTLQSQRNSSSAYPDDGNSMPPPAVPQSATHDPSAPPPSRE